MLKCASAPILSSLLLALPLCLLGSCAPEQVPEPTPESPAKQAPSKAPSQTPAETPIQSQINTPAPQAGPARSSDLARMMDDMDPAQDGWSTEVFNEEVGKQLSLLQKLFEEDQAPELEAIQALLADDFACTPLRPAKLEDDFTDGSIQVRRAELDSASQDPAELSMHGAAGLQRAFAELRVPFAEGAAAELHIKFKVTGVQVTGASASTTVLVLFNGEASQGVYQQSAEWTIDWTLLESDSAPMLASIRVRDHEEIQIAEGALFGDYTEAVLGADKSLDAHIRVSIETWIGSIQRRFYDGFYGHQGISVADVNGDGMDDVYLCQASSLPNRLYIQQEDGTAIDMAAEAGIDFLDSCGAVLFLDFDEDGDQDLLLGMDQILIFFSNDGTGKFEARWYRTYAQVRSFAAADYDQDGDLDVYCCSYKQPGEGVGAPIPYHDANNGDANILLRNDGRWEFTNVTKAVGLDVNNRRFSFASSWEDYDEDGDMDLYVANDFGRNNLYRNDDGMFVDVAAEAGVEDISAGMSVTWGDYNNDGLMDIYVSNMFSSAGNRVTYQRNFREDEDEETRALYQRHARGNSLFLNSGDGTFQDVSNDAGVTMGRWSWASKFIDINNDGRRDLVAANGFVTNQKSGDL